MPTTPFRECDDVAAIVRHLDDGAAVLLGLSMGGAARAEPARLRLASGRSGKSVPVQSLGTAASIVPTLVAVTVALPGGVGAGLAVDRAGSSGRICRQQSADYVLE